MKLKEKSQETVQTSDSNSDEQQSALKNLLSSEKSENIQNGATETSTSENNNSCSSSSMDLRNGMLTNIEKDNSVDLANGIETLCLSDHNLELNSTDNDTDCNSEGLSDLVKDVVLADITVDKNMQNNSSPILCPTLEATDDKVKETVARNEDSESKLISEETCSNGSHSGTKLKECINSVEIPCFANETLNEDTNQLFQEKPYLVEVKNNQQLLIETSDSVIESPIPQYDSPHSYMFSDAISEGSSDSGKGGSELQFGAEPNQSTSDDLLMLYEFELPQILCGQLIGRFGRHVNFIKNETNANILIKQHPLALHLKICAIEGTQSEIQGALELIRKRFPLDVHPTLSLVQVNIPPSCSVPISPTIKLQLPEGVGCDVILSSMVSPSHFFLQQPTHPTYPSLCRLDQCMRGCYTQLEAPTLPEVIQVGIVCAANIMGGWYRAEVVNILEDTEECEVKFLDYGGYSKLPLSYLRQIRSDFMTLPFQAAECYLANVQPSNESEGWTVEAGCTFEELAQGQILQAYIVAYAEDGVPLVQLYKIQGITTMFVNRELVNRGVASWVDYPDAGTC